MEALRIRTPSPDGHGSIGSSTAASSPTGFDAHFHSTFNYFGNELSQPARHRGATRVASTRLRRPSSNHSNAGPEDFTADLLRYINGRNESGNDSEHAKSKVEDSFSSEDGPLDFTENLANYMTGENALDPSESPEHGCEIPASPKTEVTITPKPSCYPPSLAVEDGIEDPFGVRQNDYIFRPSLAVEDSSSDSSSGSPKANHSPSQTPMTGDDNSDCESNSPSFNPEHITVSSPTQFWCTQRSASAETNQSSTNQRSSPFADFSEVFPTAWTSRGSPSHFMAAIYKKEHEAMLSQVEALTAQVNSWKLRSELAESSFSELQLLRAELKEWKRKGDEAKEANARTNIMSLEVTALKQLLAEREKMTSEAVSQKMETEVMLRGKEEEMLGLTAEIALQKLKFEEALRRKEMEYTMVSIEMASQKAEFEAALRRKEEENATVVASQKAEFQIALRRKEEENATITTAAASQKAEFEMALRRKEEENTTIATEVASQKIEFEATLRQKEEEHAAISTEVASQKAGFDAALRRKEEESAKAATEIASLKIKFEAALKRKEEKNERVTTESVLQKLEYEATLRQKDEEKQIVATEVENLRRLRAEDSARLTAQIGTLNGELEDLKCKSEDRLDVTFFEAEIDTMKRGLVEDAQSARAQVISLKAEIDELKAQKAMAEAEIDRLIRLDIDKSRKAKVEHGLEKRRNIQRLEAAIEEIDFLKDEVERWRTEAALLKEQNAEEMEDALDEITSLKTEVNSLRSANATQDRISSSKIASLRLELDSLKTQTTSEAELANSQITSLRVEVGTLAKLKDEEIERLANELSSLKEELNELKVGEAVPEAEIHALRANAEDTEDKNAYSNTPKAVVDALEVKDGDAVGGGAYIHEDLESKNAYITMLRAEVDALKAQARDAERGELESAMRAIAVLNAEINKLKNENAEDSNKANTRLRKLCLDLDFWKSSAREAENAATQTALSNTELEASKQRSMEECERLLALVESLGVDVDMWMSKANDSEKQNSEIASLKENLKAEAEVNSQLAAEVEKLHRAPEERNGTIAQIPSLRAEAQHWRSRAEDSEPIAVEIEALKIEVERLSHKASGADRMTSQMRQLRLKVQEWKGKAAQIGQLELEAQGWKDKVSENRTMASQIESLEAENLELKLKAEDAKQMATQITKLQADIDSWKQEIEETKQNAEKTVRAGVEASMREMDEWRTCEGSRLLKERKNAREAALREFADENERAHRDLKDTRAEVQSLIEELDKSKQKVHDQKLEMSALQSALCHDRELNVIIRSDRLKSLKKCARAEREVVDLQAEIRSRDEEISGFKEILARKDEEVAEMAEQRVAVVRQEVSAMAHQYTDAYEETRRLRHRLEHVTNVYRERLKAERCERVRVKKESERTNRELERGHSEAMKSQEKHWKDKVDAMKKEREVMARILMHQWGREECGYGEPQPYRYKYVKRN